MSTCPKSEDWNKYYRIILGIGIVHQSLYTFKSISVNIVEPGKVLSKQFLSNCEFLKTFGKGFGPASQLWCSADWFALR